MLELIGVKKALSKDDVQLLLQEFDRDGDGSVDYSELVLFLAFFRRPFRHT